MADSRILIQAGSEAEAAYVEALGDDEPPVELVALVETIEGLGMDERAQAGTLITKAEGQFNAAYIGGATPCIEMPVNPFEMDFKACLSTLVCKKPLSVNAFS